MTVDERTITIEHDRVPGRMRVRVVGLRGNRVLEQRLSERLRVAPAWHHAEARAVSGSVILQFDPALARTVVLDALRSALAPAMAERDVCTAPAHAARPAAPPHGQARLTIADPIGGWHARTPADVAAALASDLTHGLSPEAAGAKLVAEGANLVPHGQKRSQWMALTRQFQSLPVMLLAGSAVVSVATGGAVDAVATLAVLAVNAVLGYVTEEQAESVIGALTGDDARRMRVRTIRGGLATEILASDLVRGDILLLGPGMPVPVDARLLWDDRLKLDESALTGETLAVPKCATADVPLDAPTGSRPTMLYASTVVLEGRGRAMVVATGAGTVAARIAALSQAAERPRAPVEAELDRLGGKLVFVSLAACGLLLGIGWVRGYALAGILRDAVALAVAAVPEGLPVVATTTMAFGLKRMERRGILIRRVDAVESLGALQTICLDKTGTLTRNSMRVVVAAPGLAEVALDERASLTALAEALALNNDGDFVDGAGKGSSATERALLEFAAECGVDIPTLRARRPRTATLERAPGRPWMATMHDGTGPRVLVKGMPAAVLERCTHVRDGGHLRGLTNADRAALGRLNDHVAARPARLLAVAEGSEAPRDDDVAGLTWLGLVGMADPLRPGARPFIAAMHRAGLDTVMITGDQSATAGAIARELDLSRGEPLRIIDSPTIAAMDPVLLAGLARQTHVFARVSADQKLAIVQALQAAGRVVAMTGDGVNDAPALKAADIGIAMGASGTDLARDVANVVIRDDELTTLADAIGQGRTVYRNIRRALEFLVTTNMSEILVTLVEALHGPGELETPMELLWINLVTDVLPGLGLALADPDPDVMDRPPRSPGEPIFPAADLRRMGLDSTMISAAALTAHFIGLQRYGPSPQTRGMTFLALSLGQLLYTLTCQRGDVRKLRPDRLLENRALDLAVLTSSAFAVLPFLVPPVGRLLGIAPPRLADTAISLAAAAFPAGFVLARRGIALELEPLETAP